MPEARATTQAWAKVNLDLRILAREETGFHQLETIFQRVSLSDDVSLTVRQGAGITVTCTPGIDVPMMENLAFRAAHAYRQAAHWPDDAMAIEIAVTKRIPAGAGLGGGSADAGAVLRLLNALNPFPLAEPALLTIAATLGADVPFMTTDAPLVMAWGRGERLIALEPLPERPVHCALFRAGVNTADAYRALAAARAAGGAAHHGSVLHHSARLRSWEAIASTAVNDFEPAVFASRPDIAAVHAQWRAADPTALVRMSGSGATVIAIADTARDVFAHATAHWPADRAITHVEAVTLQRVPAVTILSTGSGPG